MAMSRKCFIMSASQVSCQQPLREDWLTNPIRYDQSYVRSIEPDSKEFILPSEARRMSKILKRAICTSLSVLNNSGISQPDAIVTGTGMGCFENTEKFLIDISKFGESCLKPTLFMQSTHNTISSLIAIVLKCHGYNNTYSHKGISFDSALLDAWIQILSGNIRSALVGSHDEVTPFLSLILQRSHPHYSRITEGSVSMMLSSTEELQDKKGNPISSLCELQDVKILYQPEPSDLLAAIAPGNDCALMLGLNDNSLNDSRYSPILERYGLTNSILTFKDLFGDNFSSSGLGVYAAATRIARGEFSEITVINHSDGTSWSIIKLKGV